MKKILVLVLAFVMAISLAACSKEEISDAGLEGKTKLVIGEEYTTPKNNTFKVTKVELTDEDNAHFHIYITYNNNNEFFIPAAMGLVTANVNGEDIEMAGDYSGLMIDGNSTSEIHVNLHSRNDNAYSLKKVENDSEKNGILWFPIGETDYYIEMKAFLES